MPIIQTRRRFIGTVALAGVAGLLHDPRVVAAEGALEDNHRARRKGPRGHLPCPSEPLLGAAAR
jgi:hypothetical protein